MEVMIIGGSIGGLTLGLMLHRAGIVSRIYESTADIKPLGVGINILPHASAELCELGLEAELTRAGVLTREAVFYNRFGQLIHSEPLGRFAGNRYPQFSIHRGHLQGVLRDAVIERLGRAAAGRPRQVRHPPRVPRRGRVPRRWARLR